MINKNITMKSFILICTILFSTTIQCFSQQKVIGEKRDGKYVVTVDKDSLIRAANNILMKQKITGYLSLVSIKEDVVDKTNEKYFYILFTNSDMSIKSVQLLSEVNGKFSIGQRTLEGGSTVTCTGCRKGCDPKRYIDTDNQIEFYCSECTLGNTNDCKKSVSQSSLEL